MLGLALVLALGTISDPCESEVGTSLGTCYGGSLDSDGANIGGSYDRPDGTSIDIHGGDADGGSTPPCDVFWMGECIAYVTPPPAGGVTLSDIAHFTPDVGAHAMEPNGWAVTRLPTNFYSTASAQIIAGSVLGTPAEVRFTPVRWRWGYGDGDSQTAATGGGRWSALGLQEFDPTATSHVYRERGDFEVALTVDFSAEYRVGGSGGASRERSRDRHRR